MAPVTPSVHGLARQRTMLAWQRTGLDFAVIGGLLMQASGGVDSPLRLFPGALSLCMSAYVLVAVRRASRPSRRSPGRRAVTTLGAMVVTLQLVAAVLILPR